MTPSQVQGAGLAARCSTASRSRGNLLAAPLSKGMAGVLLIPAVLSALLPAQAQRRIPQILPAPAAPTPLVSPEAAVPTAPTATQPPAPTMAIPAVAAPARLNTGLVTIESDQQRADQSTGVVTATGNVRIVYPDQRVVATARQAQYFSKEGRVVLTGDVDIVQEGGNLMRAERVIDLVESERLTAIPPEGQQVFSQMRMQTTPAATPAPTTPATPVVPVAPVVPVQP